MKYCSKCVLPDTRPGLIIDQQGVCNACNNAMVKTQSIDWKKREQAFYSVVTSAKKRSQGYDCLIPVSGGKDSTWQVVKCLEQGLNPLAVTWKTPARTEIGQKNLDNLVRLGVDHIDYQVNPKVEKKMLLKSLERFGATAIPMHLAMFNIPLKIALRFDIPLIVWGENSAFEYGTDEDSLTGFELNEAWLRKFGVSHGTTAKDWIDEDLSAKDLTPYFGPNDAELNSKGVKAVFLGYYFPWDPEYTLKIAKQHGFQVNASGPRTGLYNYADIDDDFISIHHFLKWHKFGFTRTWDNLSLEIRNNRISRQEAIEIIRKHGDETPYDDIGKFCRFTEITEDRFSEIVEKFRNLNIWYKDHNFWKIRDFLVQGWDWTQEDKSKLAVLDRKY